MTTIQERLFALQDKDYAVFQAKLVPTCPPETIIGVRTPASRKLAKELIKTPEAEPFLSALPHEYYDENLLHALMISELKDYDRCIAALETFLPYVDNWAVCDLMSPKILKKQPGALLAKIQEWSASPRTYTCRFGLELLMSFYLDDAFLPEYLEIPAAVRSEEYYVRMMVAWFFATALAKQWDAALPYLTERRLDPWTHKKTIQKACESYRITAEQKQYLRTLK